MNDNFFGKKPQMASAWPHEVGLFGSNDPFGTIVQTMNQNAAPQSSGYQYNYSASTRFDSSKGFSIETRKFMDSEGNLLQDQSRNLGNARWSRMEKINSKGERAMVERLDNMTENEKETFENEWKKRVNTPFTSRVPTLMENTNQERVIPLQRDQSAIAFNEPNAPVVNANCWNALPHVIQQHQMFGSGSQQQQPPPTLLNKDNSQGGESWSRWTLKMLRLA